MRSFSTRTAGLLILILGVWGGIVPFVGHYFHFALGPDRAWAWTMGRLYLDILPAIAAIVGGLMLIGAGPRPHARLGAWLAIAAGIWFAIGPEISELWKAGGAQGAGHGSAHIQMLEMLAYHTGLGVVMTGLAGYALPRFPLVARTAAVPAAAAGAAAGAGAGRRRGGLVGSRQAEREAVAAGEAPLYATEERPPARAAAEPVSAREAAPAEPREAAPAEPVTAREAAPAEPMTGETQAMPAAPGTSPEAGAAPVGDAPAATRTQPYDGGHPPAVRRRRRGGLLSVFSRR